MSTLPAIQPRPILCKTGMTNSSASSSPVFLLHPSGQPSNSYSTNVEGTTANNPSQISLPSIPLSSYEEFLKRLREFHRCRQTTIRCLPTIAGQVIDLQALYNTVVAHGGWEKVNDRQLWSAVANHFGIDSSCLNGTQALKQIYVRYLYAFEKISNGENIDSHEDDDEDSKRRNVSQLQRVPQTYNHSQHVVSDSLRAQYGLFRDFVRRNEYEKLELALLCGFPNELTFTLNTLLLLSSTSSSNSSNAFHLYKCPRLLEILYRHIGLFPSSVDPPLTDHYLKILSDNLWSKHLNYEMDQFWIDSCSPAIVKELLNIDAEHCHHLYKNFNLTGNDNQQQQELRIEQIVMILRNLSFDRTNVLYLLETLRSSSSLTYLFLLLTSSCEKKIELQKYAFDIWTNLCLSMHLRVVGDDEGRAFRQVIHRMLTSEINDDDEQEQQQEDRLKIIRALEMIGNLAHAGNDNGIYLIDYIDVMVNRFIHVSDILILVHTLECLYQLSELGEQLCNAILKVQSSTSILSTLIDLLTIEARSFSSQTIKTIKIVEMSSGPVLLPSYHQPPPSGHPQPMAVNPSQSVMVISTAPPTPQQQTYAVENTEMNKSYYSNTNKLAIQQQQHVKPMTVASVIASGNLLAVATAPVDNKRKHDCKDSFRFDRHGDRSFV